MMITMTTMMIMMTDINYDVNDKDEYGGFIRDRDCDNWGALRIFSDW